MNGAEALVELLAGYGVDVVFGVPGDTNVALYRALQRSGRIRHVLARDERSAVFMADAYARLARRPGVSECPSGAGAMYALPGMAEAHASSIPVILLTSDIPLSGEGRGTITELDTAALFAPITKASMQVKASAKIPEIVRRAFRVATTGRPGAVHLALPADVLEGDVGAGARELEGGTTLTPVAPELYAEPECARYPAYPTRGASAAIGALARMLETAKRPVLVAGGGVNHSGCGAEVLRLAERLHAALVTTLTGQGSVPDDHPLALGVIGDNGFHPHALRAMHEADLLLYIGCKMGSIATVGWTLPDPGAPVVLAQIDIDPGVLANTYRNALSVAGDARLVLADLLPLVGESGAERRAWIDELNRERRRFWDEAATVLASDATPLKPQRVIAELNRRLPSPAVVVADAGTPTPHVSRFLRLRGDGSRLVIPRAFGGLGYAIAAVVGAWIARPDARPIALFGDGSLGMSAGELETLVRLQVPAVLVHFNNACYGWIKALQKLHAVDFFSVDFTRADGARIADAFGLAAWRVETPRELEEALDAALAQRRPAFLDVMSESLVDQLPPVFSWLKAAGRDPLRDAGDVASAPDATTV